MIRKLSLSLLDTLQSFGNIHQDNGQIIVVGMPKSGTTAIAKLLGACIGKSVSNDPLYQLDKRGIDFRQDLFANKINIGKLWQQHKSAFEGFIVKDPNFPLLLDDLLELKPKSKFIFIIREPKQNIRSILNRLKIPGNKSSLSSEDMKDAGTWKNLLLGEAPDMPGENYIEKLAWRWVKSNSTYLKHKDTCIKVSYESFNKDKQNYIENLAKQCGFQPVNDISDKVNVRFQPKGNPSVDLQDFFGEENYARIEAIVGEITASLEAPGNV